MTSQITQANLETPVANSVTAPRGEICEELRRTLRSCTSKQELYRSALRALARYYDAPFAALHVDGASGTLDDSVSHDNSNDSPWKSLCDGLLLKARYHDLAVAKLYEASGLDGKVAALAVPLAETMDGTVGAMVVVSRCDSKTTAEARLPELRALCSMIGAMAGAIRAPSSGRAATGRSQDHEGVVKAAAHHSLHEFAFAIANSLKSKIGCEQVCLGLARRRGIKMLCMSGLDNLYPRSPGAKLVVEAMEECLDADSILCHQNEGQWDSREASTGHRLHRRWHLHTANAAVASIPLRVDGKCIAVLSLRHSANKPFQRESLQKISDLVSPLGPGLLLMEKADRGVLRQCVDLADHAARSCLKSGTWGRWALAVALVALVLWMILGTKSYIISVPCEVVPAEKRHLAAPFEGTIAAAHVKLGEHIVAGQLLVELDKNELQTQQDKLFAELTIAELELTHAAQKKDLAAAALARSRADVARAELAVVQHRIAQARICAPEDGVVLAGDLLPRVGEVVPLGEPLLEVAPGNRWSVELHIPESVAVHLATGQTGEFTTYALPDQVQPCRLARIGASTEVINGKTVFTAEASLPDCPPEWIRAGMQGMAHIDAGHHAVWWVWLHRAIDSVRLQLWKL